ncbi:polysaccharide deacetylase family sporulation protein PdaB [Legionella massiliensis]|uniref:Polysaccharide deacetylase family sporulation protein PdaB n=2 Tax=Legionella massiliensis TaxID=1034943 RepID=A0A078L518_9GAMM|nr:polysaccharide deacetylase family sporulation protein PdaB [Legionella massiliensis]CEE14741.1 Peptidoglycan-N-acetylglucosamine deacetylase [Legionella massiliensis]
MAKLIFLYATLISSLCFAQAREIAITLDDLPLIASRMNTADNRQLAQERFTKLVNTLFQYKVPATGFVIAGSIQRGQWEFLKQFRQAGFALGNHSYSHYNLNQIGAEEYIADIDRADKMLTKIMTTPKYFRYPYLAEGYTINKAKVQAYLNAHHYTIAPVTINSKDYDFNKRLYKIAEDERESYATTLKAEYLAYIWNQTLKAEKRSKWPDNKQIILLHANLLNSYLLADVLEMYQKNGYKFISLGEALKHPAPPLAFPALTNNIEIRRQAPSR